MKTNTRNYVVAGVYLAIIVTVIVAATYLGWNTLLYLIVLCLAGYGAYKLLEQTDVGQKILELVLVGPLLFLFVTIAIAVTIYPLGAFLGWLPWFYINDLPVYGSAIFEHPGMAVFVLGIEVFWGAVITMVFRAGWKSTRHGERDGL
ncbi:MAG TPA: hypothetical protein VJ646_09415 [Candidatus Binatia bacterium]|nr:hypothetical protein [Candidatus Binatia bacterium]